MTNANCEGFPISDDRIAENDRCVIKIIGIHCFHSYIYVLLKWSNLWYVLYLMKWNESELLILKNEFLLLQSEFLILKKWISNIRKYWFLSTRACHSANHYFTNIYYVYFSVMEEELITRRKRRRSIRLVHTVVRFTCTTIFKVMDTCTSVPGKAKK